VAADDPVMVEVDVLGWRVVALVGALVGAMVGNGLAKAAGLR